MLETNAFFFFTSRRRHTRFDCDWSSDVCSSDLVIAGDTTLSEITPKLEKLFSGWKPGQTPEKNVRPVQLPPKSIVYMMDKPGAQQSIIMVGNIAPPQNNPNEIAIEAMNDALGGLFLSRIDRKS